MMRKTNHPHHGHKTFLKALEAAHLGTMKGKKFLQDNRLTLQEKNLLDCFLRIRNNDFSFIHDLKENITFKDIPFLDGVKHLILGFVYVYKADSSPAEGYLDKSLSLLQEGASEKFIARMIFKAHSNLFYAHVNQKKKIQLESQFKKICTLQLSSDEDKISFKLLAICYNSLLGNYSKTEDLLEEITEFIPQMTDIQIISLHIEKFDFYIKLDLLDQAQNVLKDLKSHRTFRLSACFQYMDKLLKFIMHGERIYVYDKDFKEHNDLYLLIKVICLLDEADYHEASFYWAKLSERAPETYCPEFNYKGDKCLFSLALNKAMIQKEESNFVLQKNYTDSEEKVIQMLRDAHGMQLKKEELFKHVYDREMNYKEDLVSLASIIYRINKKEEIQIKSKKGTFYIVLEASKSA
jgi:hypothetical protein